MYSRKTMGSKRITLKVSSVAISGLALICVTFLSLSPVRAATEASPPVTTTLSIPFSGTLSTDIEDISVIGILQIVTQVTFTSQTIFARVITNISSTTGVGTKSGQKFVGVGASLQTCGLPTGPRSSAHVPLELTNQFRLIPLGPFSPAYQNVQQGSLLLILQLTFRSDGPLVDAIVSLGKSRFALLAPEFRLIEPRTRIEPGSLVIASDA
jgi:hypothetical protein